LDFFISPRLAASAAPAAICCFFDFAGILGYRTRGGRCVYRDSEEARCQLEDEVGRRKPQEGYCGQLGTCEVRHTSTARIRFAMTSTKQRAAAAKTGARMRFAESDEQR
jgi:hypothetical protein